MIRRCLLFLALCVPPIAGAQSSIFLTGKVLDSAGTGATALISIRSPADNGAEIAKGVAGADGSFRIPLPVLRPRVLVVATTNAGLVGRAEIDSLAVLGSTGRPIIIRLGGAAILKPVEVRARYQRRPSVFGFFEGEPSTRIEPSGLATDWLDPFAVGGIGALLTASPDLLVTADGGNSVMGAPGSSNQLQIGGVRVPSGLVSGQLSGNIAVSPWDASIGGAAGATVNLLLAPAGRYKSSYIILRSGIGGVPGWISAPAETPGVSVPARVTASATGPLGKFAYRANIFLARDLTPLPRWDETLDDGQRSVLDSISGVLGAPTIRGNERTVQAGLMGRLDLVPFSDKRVLALTSAVTRSTRTGASNGGFLTGSAGADFVDDAGFLQLESTRVIRQRVLWTSLLTTSLTRDHFDRTAVGPTIIATDARSGNVVVTGGAPPQPSGGAFTAEARTTGTWYSVNNRARYVAQLQSRVERARVGGQDPHATFTAESIDELRNGEALSLVRESGSASATASSIIVAPAGSARFDVGKTGSLLLGLRADAWITRGVVASGQMRYVDVSPRISFLRRIGARSANRGPVATLRLGAGRFTDWPSVQEWSDAWSGGGTSRQVCAGANVPTIMLTAEAPVCESNGTIQAIGRPVAARDLRPTAANRVDISVAIAQIAPGVRGEFGAAFAHTSRITARLSPLANAPVVDRLDGERDRAILVPANTIGAGGLVPVAAIPGGFSNATRLVSDARSRAAQWRVRIASRDPFARTKWNAAYTLTTGRERSLVIASPTSAPGFVSGPLGAGGRHTFALSAGGWIGGAEIRLAGIARSGIRFTPLADRDLNADGRINDAVFVPQSESERWANIITPSAQSCVRAAAGRIAAVNSCTGPWSISSLFLASIPAMRLGLGSSSAVELQLSNPLAAIAGSVRQRSVTFGGVRGVDPTLVHITGFDSNTQRFTGDPLEHFGEPSGFYGVTDPVRLALSVRIPLGRSVTSQRADAALQRLQGDTSARVRNGAALEYLGDLPPIPFVVLQSGEGIQLTADQRRGLQALGGRWQASAARIVVNAFTNNGRGGSESTARKRLVEARATFLAEVAAIAAEIRQLLSADQVELLPDGVQRMLNPRFLRFLADQDAGM